MWVDDDVTMMMCVTKACAVVVRASEE